MPWKTFSVMGAILLALTVAGFVLPGPIEGFWDSPIVACLCDSKNSLEFRDGMVYVSSSGHPEMRGEYGRYRMADGKWLWELGAPDSREFIEVYPTWVHDPGLPVAGRFVKESRWQGCCDCFTFHCWSCFCAL